MSIAEIRSYVGGRSQIGSAIFDHVRPIDGALIGRIFEADAEGVEAAVRHAFSVYQSNRNTPLHQRAAWVQAAAAALTANAGEIAVLISEDVGKPIRSARFEVQRGADFLLGCASALSQLNGEVLPLDSAAAGEGRFGFTRRVPCGGPIALVAPFDTIDEALELANDSPFGLQGSVFTRDLGAAFRFIDSFDVGALWINEASRFRLDLYPFGGVKQSGVGREGIVMRLMRCHRSSSSACALEDGKMKVGQ
jgi:acyl-CoA reductase-like NAD-dependent aldehyde dehydrogenase